MPIGKARPGDAEEGADLTPLSSEEQRMLLVLARGALEARVAGRGLPQPGALEGRLARPGAAFVSVHRGAELRGCLGCIEPRGPSLATVIMKMAAAAASEDPRFSPVSERELGEISIEISVLGPLLPIAGPDEIAVGRDGLVIERDPHRGLLLPQVATQWGWDAERFLAETCRKAGLPRDAWREGARCYRFEAEVFMEPSSGDACS